MADAQRTVELLTSTAAEKTDNKKACYFKAHARALELAIDRRATGIDLNSICDDANGDLPTRKYEYRTAGAAANRAETASANTTNKRQQLAHRLPKITTKETSEIANVVTRIVIPPSEMPVAMTEKIREKGRATIQQLLPSYVRRKRAMPSVTSKRAPSAVPPATETPVSVPSVKPLSSAQGPDTMTSHDFDVTMSDSTFTFRNTMRTVDLGGGDVTPLSYTASVPILNELIRLLKNSLKHPQVP